MKHDIKREKDCIEIYFEHEENEIEKAFNKEYVNIAKNLKVNGFRPGKVPVSVAKNMIKKNEIKDKVINDFIKEETEILGIEDETYDEMKIDIVDFNQNSVRSKVKMYLYPTAKIADNYQEELKKIELEKTDSITVTEDELNENCQNFLNENAEFIESEIVKEKSVVDIKVECVDLDKNEKIIDEENYELNIGEDDVDDLFEKEILTLKINETKEFNIKYVDDYKFPKLSGKNLSYKVKINKIYDRKIPTLDEEKVKEMFDVEELENKNAEQYFRDKIKENIINDKKEQIDKKNYEKIMDTLVAVTEFNISDYVLQNEKDKIFKSFLNKNELDENMTFSEFSELVEKTEEETERDFIDISKDKISSYLVLNEINKKEKLYEIEEHDMESMFKNIDLKKMDNNNLMEMIMNMSVLLEDNKNDFSLSKDKIKKTITFLIDKINQE